MSDLPTVRVREEPELLGQCPRCHDGVITDIDEGMVYCFLCGVYYYEIEKTEKAKKKRLYCSNCGLDIDSCGCDHQNIREARS